MPWNWLAVHNGLAALTLSLIWLRYLDFPLGDRRWRWGRMRTRFGAAGVLCQPSLDRKSIHTGFRRRIVRASVRTQTGILLRCGNRDRACGPDKTFGPVLLLCSCFCFVLCGRVPILAGAQWLHYCRMSPYSRLCERYFPLVGSQPSAIRRAIFNARLCVFYSGGTRGLQFDELA